MTADDELDRFLAGTALCRRLTGELRTALAQRFVPRLVPGGEVVLREGEPADGLYLVRSGRLQVRRSAPDPDDEVVGEIGRGEVVGEAALLTERARTATVVALRDSELLHLSIDAFEHPPRASTRARRGASGPPEAREGSARRLAGRTARKGCPVA